MDIATIAGLIAGSAFIIVGIYLEGNLGNFYDLPSIMITVGGTAAAMLIAYPINKIAEIGKILKKVFFTRSYNLQEVISKIIDLANIARREGLLALEEAVYKIDEPFLQKGILLIVEMNRSRTGQEYFRNRAIFYRRTASARTGNI